HHLVVEATAVQVRADVAFEVVDEAVHLVVGGGPVEVAALVVDVAVEGRDGRVDQLRHAELPSLVSSPCYPIGPTGAEWAGGGSTGHHGRMRIEPTAATLGAVVTGIELAALTD